MAEDDEPNAANILLPSEHAGIDLHPIRMGSVGHKQA